MAATTTTTTAHISFAEVPPVPARPAFPFDPLISAPSLYSTSHYSQLGSMYPPYGSTIYNDGTTGYRYGGHVMPHPSMDPLAQSMEAATQHTFSILYSFVQTFTGIAQMLESTFMATQCAFFAIIGVIEQFNQLRNMVGGVFVLFGLKRWMKKLVSGRSRSSMQMQSEFREFINGRPVRSSSGPPAPKPSKKPLIIFFFAIIGVPYLMSKLIKMLDERAKQQSRIAGQLGPLDPSMLSFARTLYPFTPSSPSELAFKENEIVAIIGKLDPTSEVEVDPRLEVETEWWRGRTSDGREGWFPRKWVEVLERSKRVD